MSQATQMDFLNGVLMTQLCIKENRRRYKASFSHKYTR